MSEHKSLAEALAAFQAEAPTLHKAKEVKGSFSYKYVELADVVEAIKPIMEKHGLSWSAFPTISSDGKPALRYVLRHAGGDVEADTMPLMLAKADAQALGSAITYGRRYALCAVLNIVADADDDGAAAKAAQERSSQTNGHLGDADVKKLQDAARGLKMAQIKLAFTACGIPIPDPFAFSSVPGEKAQLLVEALAGMERA